MFSFQGAVRILIPKDSMNHLSLFLTDSVNLYGGEYRDRTGDLLLARQALSQLS